MFKAIVCVCFWKNAGIFRRVLLESVGYFSLTQRLRQKEASVSASVNQNTKWKSHFSISQASCEMDLFQGRPCLGGSRHQRTTEGSSSSQAKWSTVSVRWPLLWDVRGSQVVMGTLAHLLSPGSFLPLESECACGEVSVESYSLQPSGP